MPFCKQKCLYCDFYSLVPGAYPSEYAGLVVREYGLGRHLVQGALRSIYLGGGTPSVLRPRDVGAMVGTLLDAAPCGSHLEITLECNPDDLSPAYLRALRGAGVNRLSIGVQSLDAATLRLLERRHDAAQAERAVAWAMDIGFDSVSADVIYGIPSLEESTLRLTVERLIALGAQHVSAYHLTREPGTRYDHRCASRHLQEVDEATSERHFTLVRTLLTGAGYEHYEISNYALPGHRACHNAGYWSGAPYLGLGPGAHAYDGQQRWHTPPNYRAYRQSLDAGRLPYVFESPLTPEESLTEWLLMRLRTAEGVDLGDLALRFGEAAQEETLRRASRWMDSGVIMLRNDALRMDPARFLLTDAVLLDLIP